MTCAYSSYYYKAKVRTLDKRAHEYGTSFAFAPVDVIIGTQSKGGIICTIRAQLPDSLAGILYCFQA